MLQVISGSFPVLWQFILTTCWPKHISGVLVYYVLGLLKVFLFHFAGNTVEVNFSLLSSRYMILLLRGSKGDWDSSGNLLLSIWTCGKALSYVLMGNLMFISVLLLGTRAMLNPSFGITRHKDIWLAVLLSSYFKLYLVAMLVWEFPPSVAYIVDIFVLSSNAVALRVLTRSRTSGCFGVCLTAHAAKYFTTHWLLPVSPGSF